MKKLLRIFETKRNIAGAFLLTGLIYTAYAIQENAAQIKKLANFESGIQTCFSRVNQTYTANVIGDKKSNYFTQNFQNLTEECFAEGILSVESSFKKELHSMAKQLSYLASNVHWFHEDILAPQSTKSLGGAKDARDVNARFEKIETTKDDILDAVNSYKSKVTNAMNNQKNIFYVLATLLSVVMAAEYVNIARLKLLNGAREKEASEELLDQGGATSVKVGDIIRQALEQNELPQCSKLFSNFHHHVMTERSRHKFTSDALVVPAMSNTKMSLEKNLDQIWEDDSFGLAADGPVEKTIGEEVNLEQLSSHTVHLLSEKIFSQGVQLDLNVPENLMVAGNREGLEQAIYHLFVHAINSTLSNAGEHEKKISAFAHKLGDVAVFDVVYTGEAFCDELLKQRSGLSGKGGMLGVDLEICESLLLDGQTKIQLDNKLDQHGRAIGGRVKMVFKAKEALKAPREGRLVDLKVGTKKEILASFGS